MRFSKWHALGNAYLLLERAELGAPLTASLARTLCDWRTGIGADGVLELHGLDGAEAELRIWNPDGSCAELSGNGARIAASWLARRSGAGSVRLRVGQRELAARVRGDEVGIALGEVDVGESEVLHVLGEPLEVTPVSVGNPHAVVLREPARAELLRLGPAIERHERFPERTNVQFVRVDNPRELTLRVWERGVGETESSGTSAVASAAVAIARGWCRSPVSVHLPGGDLKVEIDDAWNATLTGPAVEIFRGELPPKAG